MYTKQQIISMTGIKTKTEAQAIVGGLSSPSKMPGFSYGLPAKECGVGGKLRKVEGSVCSKCYALKGMYQFPVVQAAQYKRLESLNDDRWQDAMVRLIADQEVFRWHDSGDIQNLGHLFAIAQVCGRTPFTKHWLPTKEKGIVAEYRRLYGEFPPNLIVRVSAPMIGTRIKANVILTHTSSVGVPVEDSVLCDAYTREGKCDKCRKCWDSQIVDICYPLH
jgi:hypothetical protein